MSELTKEKMVECLIPQLHVSSISRSVEFYSEVLGFAKEWEYEKNGYSIAGISRDGFSIYLCESEEGSREAWVWVGMEDDSLFESILGSNARIRQKPTNYPWAYEMRVEDPDGHVLRLGAEPRTDLPFED